MACSCSSSSSKEVGKKRVGVPRWRLRNFLIRRLPREGHSRDERGRKKRGESLDESREINVQRIKDRSWFFTRNIKAPDATFWISSHPRSSLLDRLEAWKIRCSNDRACNSSYLSQPLQPLSLSFLAFHHLVRETFLFVPVSPLSRLSGQVFPSNFSTNLRLQRR